MYLKTEAFPFPAGLGTCTRSPFKGSLLEHILNHTGSKQCWAPMFVKPKSFPFPGGSRDLSGEPRDHF